MITDRAAWAESEDPDFVPPETDFQHTLPKPVGLNWHGSDYTARR